jgi:hypothetical protein
MLAFLIGPMFGLDMSMVLSLSIAEGLAETLAVAALTERYIFR